MSKIDEGKYFFLVIDGIRTFNENRSIEELQNYLDNNLWFYTNVISFKKINAIRFEVEIYLELGKQNRIRLYLQVEPDEFDLKYYIFSNGTWTWSVNN